ncbi:MIZ zinc finger protein [Cordyceps javanica]|uniref:MIZ zinc finger protein n=1 Tax=Cordyceps javanica TaxID=43265 RepID=A0A545UWS9_9HYPO|nr:MIZ zinc finger protein [Cordyceps javanica]
MASSAPRVPPAAASSPSLPFQQPFPGAVSNTSPASLPQRTVLDIPSPLPRPSFIFRTDGGYSKDAVRVFLEWSTRIERSINAGSHSPEANEVGLPRCVLLSAACKRRDIVYIVMHQRYCIWSRSKRAAHHLMQPFAPDVIDSGFTALSVLLKNNDVLSHPQLEWFSEFPASTLDSFIPSSILNSIIKQIFDFLAIFATQWEEFQARIIHRGFPALVWEMAKSLRCSSCIVQDLIFTLSRRLLGCPDGPFANAFAELLNRDRVFESTILANTLSPDFVKQGRDALVRSYLSLTRQFRSQTQSTSPLSYASPALGDPIARASSAWETRELQRRRTQTNTEVSRFAGLEQRVVEWPSQNQLPRFSTMTSAIVPSTNQSKRQLGPSIPASINQHLNQPGVYPAPPSLPKVPPWDMSTLVAQHGRPAVSHSTASTPSLAPLLNPTPDKATRRIPESEYPQNAYGLSSLKVGLHLARQRSPRRVPIHAEATRYFQYVEDFVVQPTKLGVSIKLTEIKFSLSEDQLGKLPVRQTEFDIYSLPVVRFKDSALRFRVRACRLASVCTEMNECKWAQVSTFWPEQMHLTINSMPCLLSRKQHFHTDLPAEISTDVKPGYNELRISLPSLSANENGYDYFIAVEQIITQKYAAVWRSINGSPHISADMTRNTIKHYHGLRGCSEVALLGRTSNVSICDPISSKMCDTPVRSINCKHLECFDLENWLQSRPTKPGAAQTEPCLVDCWACPICGGDARPNRLRICDYFTTVIEHLRQSGLSEMRAISISEDGEWQPLCQTSSHQKHESASQPGGSTHRLHSAPRNVEVIEIVDD